VVENPAHGAAGGERWNYLHFQVVTVKTSEFSRVTKGVGENG
jgi:hypothetical protein